MAGVGHGLDHPRLAAAILVGLAVVMSNRRDIYA